MTERFEYLVIDDSTMGKDYHLNKTKKAYLDKLGDDGWELTSVVCWPNGAERFYLKRIKSQMQD
jgi:hypothetical protein